MHKRSSKRPILDINQMAAKIVDITTVPKKKNQAAVALGRLGGRVGGRKRAEKLSPEQRSQMAESSWAFLASRSASTAS